MKIYNVCIVLTIAFCASCSNIGSKHYNYTSQDTVYVDTHQDVSLSEDCCVVSRVLPLEMPETEVGLGLNTKIVIKNDRVYAWDRTDNVNMIYVFDITGKFLYRVGGKKGRARNELIGGIDRFDVDEHNYIHLYDRAGYKLLVYDEKGAFHHVLMLRDCLPSSFVVADNGETYYFSKDKFSSADGDVAFVQSDEKGHILKCLFSSDDMNNLGDIESRPLSKNSNGVVSYLPSLSDFALVANGDSLKCIKFVFDRGFLTDSELQQSRESGHMNIKSEHVSLITKFFQNNYFLYIEYVTSETTRTFLLDKLNHRTYSYEGNLGFFNVFSSPFILDDEFACLISQDDINREKQNLEKFPMSFSVDDLHPVIKKMFQSEVKVPAVVFLKLK